LTNAEEIHDDLFKTDLRHMNTDSDSEVLLNVFAHELQKAALNPTAEDIFHAVKRVHERCKGAYGVVAMITGHGLVGFRDPNGIRPLIYGSRETELDGIYHCI
jgi:amidophosphoribosyltransferase